MAESFSAPYVECSAKTSKGVIDAFEMMLIQFFKQEKAARDRELSLIKQRSIVNQRDNSQP